MARLSATASPASVDLLLLVDPVDRREAPIIPNIQGETGLDIRRSVWAFRKLDRV